MHSRSDLLAPPSPATEAATPSPRADLYAPATMILNNPAEYLGDGQQDIGRRIGPDRLELFVATDPALALQLQLARGAPEYLAVHDVGTSTGLRLIGAIGKAIGAPVQQLAIRRQGHGVPLATLRFVEIEGRGGRRVRVYSTDVDADSQQRRQLARLLLGHARLAVLLAGELPSHALVTALQPLHAAMREGPWPNRDLLVVPLGPAPHVAAQAQSLVEGTEVKVVVTPPAARPAQAWAEIATAWNGRRGRGAAAPTAANGPANPGASVAPAPSVVAQPVPLQAMTAPSAPSMIERVMDARMPGSAEVPPPVPASAQRPAPASPAAAGDPDIDAPTTPGPLTPADPVQGAPDPVPWARYLEATGGIKGLVSACLFEVRDNQLLGHMGARPGPAHLMAQGAALYHAIAEGGRALGLGPSQPDATITLTGHHLLLHPLPGRPGVVLHAVLDRSIADPILARRQLDRIDGEVLGSRPAG